jgi:hypothetical protein
MAFESPVSKNINSWWSDCYGECPRMFYHAFAAVPEWAPPGENHILYSEGILKDVSYDDRKVEYTATTGNGTEYLRLNFKPVKVALDGAEVGRSDNQGGNAYTLRRMGKGDYALTIRHNKSCRVEISG